MDGKTEVGTADGTGKNLDKPKGKSTAMPAPKRGAQGARGTKKTAVKRRTKKQMAEDQHAYFRLKEILKAERDREDGSAKLIEKFEEIKAEFEEQGLKDWQSLKFG